jgi:hypothetical protein
MATVTIFRGSYRNQEVINKTFTLVKGYTVTANSKHVTVDAMELFDRPQARIKVNGPEDFVIDGVLETDYPMSSQDEIESEPESTETDEEILARINERFDILNDLTRGARAGDIRALFVCGAPGVGKTYGVEKTLQDESLVDILSDVPVKYQVISGAMSPVGLYMKLYEFRDENNVLVIDDCDSVFRDELCLNLLKAASDTSKHRMIHWNVDSVSLRKDDVPNDFEYKGSLVFISNLNFSNIRSQSMRSHMTALMSRAFFLDLTIHTTREKLIRIEDLIINKKMLASFKLSDEMSDSVMNFVRDNASRWNELSLRTVIKLAGLARTFKDSSRWQTVARMSMMDNRMTA